MIYTESTKKGVGVTIYGDAIDLYNLHETIHTLLDAAPFDEDQKQGLYTLAYEIRHAHQGDREIKKIEYAENKNNIYFGTKLAWPQVLFEVAVLRNCSGYCETNKEHLSNLYRLEYSLEKALLEYDSKVGAEAIEAFRRIRHFSKDYLTDFVADKTYDYIYSGSTGKMRFRSLPALLRSLDELSNDYKDFSTYMWEQAKTNDTHPVNLHDTREWGDIEW